MPNGYSVVPNVLPGNVTIGGNLTVSGDVIRVGAASPFFRLGKTQGGVGFISHNLANDGATRDDTGSAALDFILDHSFNAYRLERRNSAGNIMQPALPSALFTDYTSHAHTGTTTEDTIYSKVIRGNTLGANGAMLLRMFFSCSTQGATPSTFKIRLGGSLVESISVPAVAALYVEWLWVNVNSEASSRDLLRVHNLTSNAWTNANGTNAIDTSADKTLVLAMQNGANTDVQTFFLMELEQLNSFGPV